MTHVRRTLQHLRSSLGLDLDVVPTLLFRAWGIIAGGITMLLVPTFLSPAQQGYFYTFSAVLAMQVFFELGLNHVLIQRTSHAAAHLQRVSNRLVGEDQWLRNIASLVSLSLRWNSVMASLFFVVMMTGGGIFFSHAGTLPNQQWLWIWIVLVSAAALNLATSALLAICEGLGQIGLVAQLRLYQSIAGFLLLWILLLNGAGLWAATAVPVAAALGTSLWLLRQPLLGNIRRHKFADRPTAGLYNYRKDIFPLQWRIALSWASGYFIFSFITPVVFAQQGAVAAGQIGLALTIFSSISTLGISWISAKIPSMSSYIARNDQTMLNSLFRYQAGRAVAVTALGVAATVAMVYVAGIVYPAIWGRLPSIITLILLAITTIANSIIFCIAAYVRAHGQEPLLMVSIVTSILTALGVYSMASISVTAAITTYVLINILVTLPWSTKIYFQYRYRTL